MAKNSKQTSKAVATTASKILRDGRYGKAAKSVAGSALAQTRPNAKKQQGDFWTGGDRFDNQPACLSQGRENKSNSSGSN